MIPAILGLGGLTARIVATAVIPRVVRAISSSFSTTKTIEPRRPLAVEGISSAPEPAPTPVLSGVFAPSQKSRKWGYAGLWHHQASGLDLAVYRAYDAANKRWISRDPLGEWADRTLYSYAFNSPINFVDPAGLDGLPPGFTVTSSGGINAYSNWNDFNNGPHNPVPDTSSSSSGPQSTGSNGVTGGQPAPVGGSGHVHPGGGGTWWDNSIVNTHRDGNAASAGDVYTGTEKTANGVLLLGVIILPETKISEILKFRKGSIKQAPLPKGCPGWAKLSEMTWAEVGALPGKVGRTVHKLLTDSRFAK